MSGWFSPPRGFPCAASDARLPSLKVRSPRPRTLTQQWCERRKSSRPISDFASAQASMARVEVGERPLDDLEVLALVGVGSTSLQPAREEDRDLLLGEARGWCRSDFGSRHSAAAPRLLLELAPRALERGLALDVELAGGQLEQVVLADGLARLADEEERAPRRGRRSRRRPGGRRSRARPRSRRRRGTCRRAPSRSAPRRRPSTRPAPSFPAYPRRRPRQAPRPRPAPRRRRGGPRPARAPSSWSEARWRRRRRGRDGSVGPRRPGGARGSCSTTRVAMPSNSLRDRHLGPAPAAARAPCGVVAEPAVPGPRVAAREARRDQRRQPERQRGVGAVERRHPAVAEVGLRAEDARAPAPTIAASQPSRCAAASSAPATLIASCSPP